MKGKGTFWLVSLRPEDDLLKSLSMVLIAIRDIITWRCFGSAKLIRQ